MNYNIILYTLMTIFLSIGIIFYYNDLKVYGEKYTYNPFLFEMEVEEIEHLLSDKEKEYYDGCIELFFDTPYSVKRTKAFKNVADLCYIFLDFQKTMKQVDLELEKYQNQKNESSKYNYLQNQWIKYDFNVNVTSDNEFFELFWKALQYKGFEERSESLVPGGANLEEIEWIKINFTNIYDNLAYSLEIKIIDLDETIVIEPRIMDLAEMVFPFLLPKDKEIGDVVNFLFFESTLKNIVQKNFIDNKRNVYYLYDKKYELDESKSSASEYIMESYYDNQTRLLLETKLNIKWGDMSGILTLIINMKAVDWSFD